MSWIKEVTRTLLLSVDNVRHSTQSVVIAIGVVAENGFRGLFHLPSLVVVLPFILCLYQDVIHRRRIGI